MRTNHRVARHKTRQAERAPFSLIGFVMNKPLPLKQPIGAYMLRWQIHAMIYGGDMFCGHANLNHLQIFTGKEHAMTNFRRLDHAISSFKAKRWTLVLIDQIHPALVTIDQLKPDRVEMHHIRHRSAAGNADVTGDD